jgi:hypothetical protein
MDQGGVMFQALADDCIDHAPHRRVETHCPAIAGQIRPSRRRLAADEKQPHPARPDALPGVFSFTYGSRPLPARSRAASGKEMPG